MNKKGLSPTLLRVFVCLHTKGYATESLAEASCFLAIFVAVSALLYRYPDFREADGGTQEK